MKLNLDKLYPYPVLKNGTNDYLPDCFFSTVIQKVNESDREVTFSFNAELHDNGLANLIKENKARIIYHIECVRTAYRDVIHDYPFKYEKVFSKDNLLGKVEILPLIVATENFIYSNDNFNEIYSGTYPIKEGYVLAIDNNFEAEITFEHNKKESIFDIIPNTKNKSQENLIVVDLSNDKKICIALSEKNYLAYKNILKSGNKEGFSNLVSVVVVPALLDVLSQLRLNGIEEYEGTQWLKTLQLAMSKNGCEKIDDREQYVNLLELSQRLLGSQVTDALSILLNE